MNEEVLYEANPRYLEEATYIIIIEMLERLPQLKDKIRRYLAEFPK